MDIIKLNLKNYISRADVKYKDFVAFTNLLENNDEIDEIFLSNRILKIFYGLDIKTIRSLKQTQIDDLLERFSKVIEMPESPFRNVIIMNGIKYGFVPNFGEITAGELIDIEDCYARKDFYQLTSILYRPIVGKIDNLGRYTIEDYKGYNDKFKDITLDIIEGYMSLFTKSFQTLSLTILSSTRTQMIQEQKMMMEK